MANKIKHALLTNTELEWLLGRIKVSKQYEYRIKSDIRKKVKIFQELELPILLHSGFTINLSPFTQDLSANPQLQRTNLAELEDQRFSIHEIVGRKGFEPSTPAMSRRYLNQARPPALIEFESS
jgi:hypothetical protein